MARKCYKSNVDKKFSGVCGGIAEYLDIDSTLVRLIWVAFSLAGGSGLLAYIIAACIMPDQPSNGYNPYNGNYDNGGYGNDGYNNDGYNNNGYNNNNNDNNF